MRNLAISILVVLLSVFLIAGTTLADPQVVLDGRTLSFDVPPTIDQGRTLVPLRAIFEAMGATLSWDQASQTAIATKNGNNVALKIGSLQPAINGTLKQNSLMCLQK